MSYKTAYWDAAVFHALFSKESGREEVCKKIEQKAHSGEIIIYTSAITMVECVWLKGIPKMSSTHEPVIQAYFQHRFIRIINCDRPIAESARPLIWRNSVHPRDAIHVASALYVGADVLMTYDDALVKLSDKIGKPPLKICAPAEKIDLSPPLSDPQQSN